MAENKNQSGQQQGDNSAGQLNDDRIHGRLYNSRNPEFKDKDSIDDISHVDNQEGNMNHGEEGGNFNKEENSTDGNR